MPSSASRKARRQAAQGGAEPIAEAPATAVAPAKKRKVKSEASAVATEPKKRKADGAPEKKTKKPKGTPAASAAPKASTEWDADDAVPDEDEPAGGASGASTKRSGKEKISCTLFVGQLPYSASAADVKKHFRQGGVQDKVTVRLLTRRDGGGSRGLAFVELASEADVHTALRLHKSPMSGRRINVERTVGGGGKTEARASKLSDLRERQGTQMKKQVHDMIESILPTEADAKASVTAGGEDGGSDDDGGGGGGGGGWGTTPAVHRGDVDERVLEFLATVPTDMAEAALREAKALGMGGIRNRPAYLMGVLKRKVAEADKARADKEKARKEKSQLKQQAINTLR